MDKIIIVRLAGGLGNQLFQYAVGKMLSLKFSVPMKLDLSSYVGYEFHEYSLTPFNIQENILSEKEYLNLFKPQKNTIKKKIYKFFGNRYKDILHIYEENNFYFDSQLSEIKPSIYISGYWQSEKYFLEIVMVLKKEFEINIPPSHENNELLIKIRNSNSICIHIRRGDYVSVPKFNAFHGTCSLEYYFNAIKYIKERIENPIFYIFSNDIPWSKEHLNFEGDKIFVDINDSKTDYEDLRLMQNCKHNIIANSTFSWWGAWLNENPDKIVIAPEKWFENEEMQNQTQDLIPESWIRI